MKHTPGPWSAENTEGVQTDIIDGYDQVLATCYRPLNAMSVMPDALLMAAGPELLDACKAALPALRWSAVHQPGNYAQCNHVIALIEEAIQKAEGGQ
jgi:hypothetical protein